MSKLCTSVGSEAFAALDKVRNRAMTKPAWHHGRIASNTLCRTLSSWTITQVRSAMTASDFGQNQIMLFGFGRPQIQPDAHGPQKGLRLGGLEATANPLELSL